MLERYAGERGYNNIRFYIDDGVSGTTFRRPGFRQMISDMQSGQVRRVIVKDMSRFGRDYLQVDSVQEQKRAFAEMQRTLDTQRARHSELDVIIRRLYEDNIKGKLSDERFAKMSAGYEAEQAGFADSIQKLTAALSEKKDKTANISRFLSLVKRNLSFEDLTRDVLNTFIQKIVVHEVDKSSGRRVQNIDIYYNFIGKIEGV